MESRFRTPKLILEYYSLAFVTSDYETQIPSSNRRLQKLWNNLPINYREFPYPALTGKMASELDLRTEREVTNQPGADNHRVLLDSEEAQVVTIYSYNGMTYPAGDKTMNISSRDIGIHLDHSGSP
jgi:hypothetical protein